ncbi:hypothetical protein IC617_03570 [Neiella sp. HB171785]|uniref:Uncharacterized protein n=1 Tax=Neiella litorisoli TaxID=2771431 RepID=A0A8J6QU26_9GAMM|nr:hypothetical protein [Neiella litorisoli]MBD1388498.1 hypothetical protein [Neiella litorisoli]
MALATCIGQSAYAGTEQQSPATQQEAPSMAFLEYLAELEQVDCEWLSALDVAEHQVEPQAAKQGSKNKSETAHEQEDGQ